MPDNHYDGEDRRSDDLNAELVKAVVCAVRSEVSILSVSVDAHREHHTFITEWIVEKQRKRERAEKIKAQVGGWAVITVLSGIGTGVWHLASFVREHMK